MVSTACLGGEIPQAILGGRPEVAREVARWYRGVFGDDFYLEIQRHKTSAPNYLRSYDTPMILKEHELLQIDADFISRLREQDPDALAGLSIKLVSDLKEVLERLNQNPTNSSRPSGSLAPWDKGITDEKEEDDESAFDEKEALQSKTGINK